MGIKRKKSGPNPNAVSDKPYWQQVADSGNVSRAHEILAKEYGDNKKAWRNLLHYMRQTGAYKPE